jgi:protein-tyrosine-phosphatase
MEWADVVYGLSAGHTKILREGFPVFAGKINELPGGDVPDPYGGTQRDYLECAERLKREIEGL